MWTYQRSHWPYSVTGKMAMVEDPEFMAAVQKAREVRVGCVCGVGVGWVELLCVGGLAVVFASVCH